jgi:hypothetical protein
MENRGDDLIHTVSQYEFCAVLKTHRKNTVVHNNPGKGDPHHAKLRALAQNRVLRGGAYLSAGLAVYDLTQGDYENAAIGGLNALGLALIAAPEPWTSVAGLAIVSGTTLYSLKDIITSDGLGDHVDFEF